MVEQADFTAIQQCVAKNDFAAADAICERISAQKAAAPGFWNMRGSIAVMAKDWANAEAYFTQTLTLAPEAGAPLLGLARVYAATNRASAAGLMAERAVGAGLSNEDWLAAFEIVAHAKFSMGDIEGGRTTLAALAPAYREKAHLLSTQRTLLPSALSAAMFANDLPLLQFVIQLRYPHTAGNAVPMKVAPMSTLDAWCRKVDVPCRVLDPPRDVKLEATSSYSRPVSYTTDPILFASIPDGRWIPGWDFALGSDGTVLEDSEYLEIKHVFNHAPHDYFPAAALVAHRAPPIQIVNEDVLLISAPVHNHVGHWLVDFLPRLLGLAQVPDVKVAVPENLRGGKFTDTLALAGLDESRLFRCRLDRQYSFRTLHVYRAGKSHPPHPTHVKFLQDLLHGQPPDSRPCRKKGKRVFLARESVKTRLVVNAAEFADVLSDFGFISVELEKMSIADQRALIADADVLLGAFGSNLFGMYFAPPGCTVIAMQWDDQIDPSCRIPAPCSAYHISTCSAPRRRSPTRPATGSTSISRWTARNCGGAWWNSTAPELRAARNQGGPNRALVLPQFMTRGTEALAHLHRQALGRGIVVGNVGGRLKPRPVSVKQNAGVSAHADIPQTLCEHDVWNRRERQALHPPSGVRDLFRCGYSGPSRQCRHGSGGLE